MHQSVKSGKCAIAHARYSHRISVHLCLPHGAGGIGISKPNTDVNAAGKQTAVRVLKARAPSLPPSIRCLPQRLAAAAQRRSAAEPRGQGDGVYKHQRFVGELVARTCWDVVLNKAVWRQRRTDQYR